MRFDFRNTARRGQNQLTNQALIDLRGGLLTLLSDPDFVKIISALRYRGLSQIRKTSLHPKLADTIPLQYAIELLIESIDHLTGDYLPAAGQIDIFETTERLARVLPAKQNVAPLKFDIFDDKLIILKQKSSPETIDEPNIDQAKSELERNGERIIDQLNSSNCDRRLIDSILDLQGQISSGRDIIRLGLANIGCDIICEKFGPELPDAVAALLRAHTVGVSMYVSQFPEWRRFTEQAATSEILESHIPIIHNAANELITDLRKHPEAVDPEVPRLLHAINHCLENPAAATKKAAFAVWRSVENLVIRVFGYGNLIIKRTLEKISDDLPSAASKTIVRTLMATAVAGAISLTPVANHLPDGAWLSKAIEIVQKQIELLPK